MQKDTHILLACDYETGCGGETVATEYICRALGDTGKVRVIRLARTPLTQTSTYGYFIWTMKSFVQSVRFILRHKTTDWFYTPTDTAAAAAAILKSFFGYSIAFHYHGNRLPARPVRGKRWVTQSAKYYLALWLHGIGFAASDLIFVPSEHTRRVICSEHPEAAEKIIILTNGVDSRIFKPLSKAKRRQLRQRMRISPQQKVILYCGRLHPVKMVDKLIMVFAKLRVHNPDVLLMIAHPPSITIETREHEYILRLLIEKLDIQQSVRWFSYLQSRKLSDLYNVADAFVFLSREDQLPLVIMEALASGTPILSTPVGGITEVLLQVDKKTLLLQTDVPYISDRIVQNFHLPHEELDSMFLKGRAIAVKNSWHSMAQRLHRHLITYPKRTR